MYYKSTWQKIENNYSRRNNTLGQRLEYWCQYTGVNKRQLAEFCKVYGAQYGVLFTPSLIYRYAKDVCTPKMDKLTVLSKVTGMPVTWLLGYGSAKILNYKRP